jgi:hypothetical protein
MQNERNVKERSKAIKRKKSNFMWTNPKERQHKKSHYERKKTLYHYKIEDAC